MLAKFWLGVRSVAMTVLFPGTVVGYLPYRILRPYNVPAVADWTLAQYAAAGIGGLGSAVLLLCIWNFARHGRGTLAPFDEPRKLVIEGLYRYVRNPMYVGVVLILVGEALFFWSGRLLVYAGIFFLAANVFVMGYEEWRLRSKFGAEYEAYCREVGRWLPGRPYGEAADKHTTKGAYRSRRD